MANNNIELEVKFPLKNPSLVKEFLNKNTRLISADVFQKDTYFIPFHRDFLSVKYPFEWLRLRETAKGFSINYKHFHPENVEKTDYCDEYESKIENIEAIKDILKSLNFKEVIIVEKSRTIWIFSDVEISIDEVKDLGSFIELEATKHFEDPKEGKEFLYSNLKKINASVGEEDLRGYPFRVLEKKGYKF